MDPYRAKPVSASVAKREHRLELFVGLAIAWAFAIARVGLGIYMKQPFGAELTLAALAVFVIPLLLRA